MKGNYEIDNRLKEIKFPIEDWEAERGVVNLSGAAFYFIEELGVFTDKDEVTRFENGQPSKGSYCRSEQGRYYQIGVSFTRERLSGEYILFRFNPEKKEIHIFG